MNMVENIRRIGIFMIAAQTVMHFAAGKQYEKYMKIVTGVMVLLLFIGPFTASSENPGADWQTEIERMERQMQSDIHLDISNMADSVETAALRQMEQEIKRRLNDAISDRDCTVTDVVLDLEEIGGKSDEKGTQKVRNWEFRCVKVILQGKAAVEVSDANGNRTIRIEEINIGHSTEEETQRQKRQELDQNAGLQEYQQIIARTLGISDDRVEVIYRGGW